MIDACTIKLANTLQKFQMLAPKKIPQISQQ